MESALAVEGIDKVLVRTILDRALEYPWKIQELGLLSLRLDERKEHALHVWAPPRFVGPPPIHDHPYAFTSTVIVGEITNTRYVEDRSGEPYVRERYSLPDETVRRADHVLLSGEAEVYTEGEAYSQLADELHGSAQLPGTVTLLRRRFVATTELTVCRPVSVAWVTGAARLATPAEITSITAQALSLF